MCPIVLSEIGARLRQVLVNLLGNAIKFTAEGEVVLDVSKKSRSEESVTLEFQVRDSGIGIAEDKLDTCLLYTSPSPRD